MASIPTESLGRPIKGPSALAGDRRRMLSLTWTLAITDFRLKFFGSVLGYLWQLGRPLLLFGILYTVFTHVVKLGSGVNYYPVVLLTGIVMFSFVAECTAGAVSSVVDREGIVRKIQFPRLAIPLAVVVTGYLNLGLNLIAVLVFMFASGVSIGVRWLELPLILLFGGVFVSGIAMMLSALYVRFRDVRPIWDVVLQMLFYAAPVLYPIEKVSAGPLRTLMMCNPLAVMIQQTRHALIDPTAPSAADAIGGAVRLLIPFGITAGLLVLGFWIFNREAPRIAEEL